MLIFQITKYIPLDGNLYESKSPLHQLINSRVKFPLPLGLHPNTPISILSATRYTELKYV